MKKLTLILLLSGFGLFVFAQKPGKLTSFRLGLEGGVSPNVGTTQYANLGLTARFSLLAGPGMRILEQDTWFPARVLIFKSRSVLVTSLYFQNNFSYKRNLDII